MGILIAPRPGFNIRLAIQMDILNLVFAKCVEASGNDYFSTELM